MARPDDWMQIPTSLVNIDDAIQKADLWRAQQRKTLADTWAQAQKNVIQQMQDQWQKQVSGIVGQAPTVDDQNNYAPISSDQPLPSTPDGADMGSSPNPSDILYQAPNAPKDHLQDGSPENNWLEAMREGSSQAGNYIPPVPDAATDPIKEAALKLQSAQQDGKPLTTDQGLGIYNQGNPYPNPGFEGLPGQKPSPYDDMAGSNGRPLENPSQPHLPTREELDQFGASVERTFDPAKVYAATQPKYNDMAGANSGLLHTNPWQRLLANPKSLTEVMSPFDVARGILQGAMTNTPEDRKKYGSPVGNAIANIPIIGQHQAPENLNSEAGPQSLLINIAKGWDKANPNQPFAARVHDAAVIAGQAFQEQTVAKNQAGITQKFGGEAGGAYGFAANTVTDPLMINSLESKEMMIGAAMLGITATEAGKLLGWTPEETAQNVQNAMGMGTMVGPAAAGAVRNAPKIAEGVRNLAGKVPGALAFVGRALTDTDMTIGKRTPSVVDMIHDLVRSTNDQVHVTDVGATDKNLLAYNRTTESTEGGITKGKVTMGETPEFRREYVRSQYPGAINTAMIKELTQNAVDASRGFKGARTKVLVSNGQKSVLVTDEGTGMLPDVLGEQFSNLGGSLKAAGSSGGKGTAKAAFLGNAERILVRTVAFDPVKRQYVESLLSGSGDDFLDPKKGLDIISGPVNGLPRQAYIDGATITPKSATSTGPTQVVRDLYEPWRIDNSSDAPVTGTKIYVKARPDANWNDGYGDNFMKTFMDQHKMRDQTVTFSKDTGSALTGGTEVKKTHYDPRASYGEPGYVEYSKRANAVPATTFVKTVDTPSAILHIYRSDGSQESGTVRVHLLNAGQYQASEDFSFGEPTKVPLNLSVDVVPKGSARDGDYPWKPDRSGLIDTAQEALKDYIRDSLVGDARMSEHQKVISTIQKGAIITPTAGMTAPKDIMRVIDSQDTLHPGELNRLANRPYVQLLSTTLSNLHRMLEGALVGRQVGNGFMQPSKFLGMGTSRDWLGLNIGQLPEIQVDKNSILINPWSTWSEVYNKRMRQGLEPGGMRVNSDGTDMEFALDPNHIEGFTRAMSASLLGTLLHEMAHNSARDHFLDFSQAMTHILEETGFENMAKMQEYLQLSLQKIFSRQSYVQQFERDMRLTQDATGKEDVFGKFSNQLQEGAQVRPGEGDANSGVPAVSEGSGQGLPNRNAENGNGPTGGVQPDSQSPSDYSRVGNDWAVMRRAGEDDNRTGYRSREPIPALGLNGELQPTVASTRMLHGTNQSYRVPDTSKFNANGLYGPGFYSTDGLEPSEGYTRLGEYRNGGVPNHIQMLQRDVEEYQKAIETADREPGRFHPDTVKQWKAGLVAFQEQLDEANSHGPNTRAINVPHDMNFFDVRDEATPEDLDRIAKVAVSEIEKTEDELRARNPRGYIRSIPSPGSAISELFRKIEDAKKNGGPLTNDDVYHLLTDTFGGDKARTNQVLSAAGYDGIAHTGGLRNPIRDSSGEPIHHEVNVIFPQSMKKVTNSISGTPFGSPPAVGGAVVGAVYGSQQGDTPEERAKNALKGALAGGLLGYHAGGGEIPFGMSIKPVHTSPLLQRGADMLFDPAPKSNYISGQGSLFSRAVDDYVRAWTDSGIDLSKIQNAVSQRLGRGLNAAEMLAELRRLNPIPSVQVRIRQSLAPAIQQVGDDQGYLSEYLMFRHNIEVANAQGAKAQQNVMGQPLGTVPATAQLVALQGRLRMYNRFLQQAQAASDGTAIMHYTPLITRTQRYITVAQGRLARQIGVAQAAQAVKAAATGQAVTAARKFSGDFNIDESIQALQDMEQEMGPQRYANIEDAAQKVVDFGHTLLQRRVDAGIITPQFAQELRTQYPLYVPIRIMEHMIEPIPAQGGGGKSLSMGDHGIRTLSAEGTIKKQQDPLASIITLAYQTEASAMKNETFNAVHNLVTADPTLANVFKAVNSTVGDTATTKVIHGYVNGVPTHYQMPRDLALSVENQGNSNVPALNMAMSFTRAVLASKNPLFIPTHALITAVPYLMRTAIREGGPQSIPRVLGALLPAYWDAFKGLPTGRYGPETEKYLLAGGGMFGHVFDYSPKAAQLALDDLKNGNALKIDSMDKLRRASLGIIKGDPFGEIINRVDLAPRVAAAKLAAARGANQTQAITEGRTSTIDFAQGGNWAKTVNQVIPFFNVAAQGPAVVARAYRDNPRAFIGTALAVTVAPTVAIEAWNRSTPQRSKDYEDVPNFYKDSGWVIMSPTETSTDAQGNRRPNFIYIPTREFSPFIIATRELAGRALGGTPRSWQSLLYGNDMLRPQGGVLSGMSPAGDATRLFPGGPLGNTAIAAVTGKNETTGGTIVSQGADQRSGLVANTVAQGINTGKVALGGMPTTHPSEVQYIEGQMGGPGHALASVGTPPLSSSSLNPLYKNSIGQDLLNAKNARLTPQLRQLLLDADLPEVTPALQVVSGIQLTDQEEAELQRQTNAAFEQIAPVVLSYPAYQNAAPDVKKEYVRSVLTNVRKTVGGKYIMQLQQQVGAAEIRRRIKQGLDQKKAS